MVITGTHINYYCFCERRLWLSLKYINMEQYNENVLLGKLIEENSYKRRSEKQKQVLIDNIKIDYIDFKNKTLYETKKSSKHIESAIYQMKYYLYLIRDGYKGVVEIPKEKKKIEVELTENDISEIEIILKDIEIIYNNKCPNVINEKKCEQCSFYEFCYI